MNRRLVNILGYGVDDFSFNDAVDYAKENCGQIVTLNPEMILNASKDTSFSTIIKNADLVVADGVGVEIGLKILGHKVHRIAGIELGKALIEEFAKKGKSIAMIGAKPEVIDLACKKLKNEYPEINFVYIHDGYFTDDNKIMEEVAAASPDLVLVALGSPKQEFFIHELKQKLPNALMIGLGGSFDVWAGVVKRAPKIYQKVGLEWLYRTIKEPKRIKRIFPTLPMFIIKVLQERATKQ